MTLTRVERRLQVGAAGEARESIGLEASNPYTCRRHLSNAPSRFSLFFLLISNHVSYFPGKNTPSPNIYTAANVESRLNLKSFLHFHEDLADSSVYERKFHTSKDLINRLQEKYLQKDSNFYSFSFKKSIEFYIFFSLS